MPFRRIVLSALAATTLASFVAPAGASVDTAAFAGSFRSTCTLPAGPEGPVSGPYSCTHTTASVSCNAVADTGTVTAYVKLCRANLASGKTVGSATPTSSPSYWRCENGAGTGTFFYQPSTSEPFSMSFPVTLEVVGGNVTIHGSATQSGSGRQIVVDATFPAICTYSTTLPTGYAGTVTP